MINPVRRASSNHDKTSDTNHYAIFYIVPSNEIAPIQKEPIAEDETIAAISTPYGESGIGIVRLSGPLSERIARRLFKPKKEFSDFLSHHFHYGEIVDPGTGRAIDETLLVLMKGPRTYTREDIVEIHCHGGYLDPGEGPGIGLGSRGKDGASG